MKAIVLSEFGDESVLQLGDVPDPTPGPGEVRLRVHATAVNRADLMQRRGMYPPPPGAPEILGLECAGEVAELGAGVDGWKVGDRAMALLAGGGYAEQTVVHAGSLLPIPERLSFEEAAAVPEVFLTVFLNVFQLGGLNEGGTVLVHGGGSGIGTACIQLAKHAGAQVIVTAGSPEKCQRCLDLGADRAVDYREGDFVAVAKELTGGEGVDVVLDSIGAPYLEKNLSSLRVGGRLVLIGLMGGAKAEISLGALLMRRLQVIGSTLRARPVDEKAELARAFWDRFGAGFESGALSPVVDRVLPLAEAADAHRLLQASHHFGKVVLRV
ncbi:MAG: NAD(P)H-quinone oxidoreductase [Myxococcota bacterium]